MVVDSLESHHSKQKLFLLLIVIASKNYIFDFKFLNGIRNSNSLFFCVFTKIVGKILRGMKNFPQCQCLRIFDNVNLHKIY